MSSAARPSRVATAVKPISKSKTAAKVQAAAKPGPHAKGRQVLYPEITINEVLVPPMEVTVELAKEKLGWEEEPEGAKWGEVFFLKDMNGTKVRLANNTGNRPYHSDLALNYAQQYLKRQWKVNGETLIIGQTGLTLSCQHRLIGLVLAEQIRTGPQSPHWEEYWDGPVSFMGYLLCGISEDDATVNTLDTGRGRNLADLFYRSEWFAKEKPRDRRVLASMANAAVRMSWARTGHEGDPFSPRFNHAEAMGFFRRYPRLKEAIKHIYAENGAGGVSHYLTPGYASALLYLMGCSATGDEQYHAKRKAGNEYASEKQLDFTNWDKACDYWVKLSSGVAQTSGGELPGIKKAMAKLLHECDGEVRNADRIALVVKGWNRYVRGLKVESEKDVDVSDCYTQDENTGEFKHTYTPSVGGIDMGSPKEKPQDEPDVVEHEEGGYDSSDVVDEAKAARIAEYTAKAAAGASLFG